MSLARKFAGLAIASNVAIGGVFISQASAAPPTSCVSLASSTSTESEWNWASATNNCANTQHIKFKWNNAPNGECIALEPGWTYSEGRTKPGALKAIIAC
ncbi:MAG: hypothetical protein ACK5PP_13985 [Acidimicrobiales bacterium]